MDKPLEQMTEEELGRLFPIMLSDPDPDWARLFQVPSGFTLFVAK